MNKIYLIIAICFFGACSGKKNDKEKIDKNELSASVIDSVKVPNVEEKLKESQIGILDLPFLGQFELVKMKIDSTNEYGAGDCWRNIKRYSSPNVGLAIDSMTCGEYGYTYTYYLLSPKDFIQVVYTKKSESLLNPENTSYYYVLQEQIIDFNSEPAITMLRTDTVYDHLNKVINKPFVKDTLKDRQTSYEHWQLEYNGIWEMELDY